MADQRLAQFVISTPNAAGDGVDKYIVGLDPALVATKAELTTKTDTSVTATIIDRLTTLENEPEVDLSGYVTTGNLTTVLATKTDATVTSALDTRVGTLETDLEAAGTATTTLAGRVTALENEPEVDLSGYATTEALTAASGALDTRLGVIENDYITIAELNSAIADINLTRIVGRKDTVEELPTEGNNNGDIWLVGLVSASIYEEYIYYDAISGFELFGSLSSDGVDLSDYVTFEALTNALTDKADVTALTEGLATKADSTTVTNMQLAIDDLEAESITGVSVNGTVGTVTDGIVNITLGTSSFTVVTDADTGDLIGTISFT